MSSLNAFTDFVLATRPKAVTDPGELVSQASKYRTNLYSLMLKGLTSKITLQGGSEIVDFVQLTAGGRGRYVDPTDTYNYTQSNTLSQLKVPWRFFVVDSVTYEHEIDLNQGGPEVVYKRIKDARLSELERDWWESHEDALWADPDYEKMEAANKIGTGKPLSLRCFITDDGGAPTSSNGGVASGSSAWTTVMGVSPSTKTNWKNQAVTYDNTSKTTRENTYIAGLDKLWLRCQFISPSTTEEYYKNTTLNKMRILNNESTHLMLVALATSKNNVLTPKNDIGYQNGNVIYHGIPTQYVARLDTIDTGADTGTTALYRSRFVNFNHIRPVFHSKHFRRMRALDGGAANPNAKVMLEDTYENLWCANRREQGILVAA